MKPTRGALAGRSIRKAELSEAFRARFATKFVTGNGCWPWVGSANDGGYGQIRLGRIRLFAHRVAVVLDRGFLRDGEVVDHLCNNPWCVNPRHLRVTTQRENWLRGRSPTARAARSGLCLRGLHSMREAYQHGKAGAHQCSECRRTYSRGYHAKHRDKINAVARAKYAKVGRPGRRRKPKNSLGDSCSD